MKLITTVVALSLLAAALAQGNADGGNGEQLLKSLMSTDDTRQCVGDLPILPHQFYILTVRDKPHAASAFFMYFTTIGLPRWRTSFYAKTSDHGTVDKVAFTHRFGILGYFEYDGSISGNFSVNNLVKLPDGSPNIFVLAGRGNEPAGQTCTKAVGCWNTMTTTGTATSAYYTVSSSFTGVGATYSDTTVTLDTYAACSSESAVDSNSTAGPNKLKFGMSISGFPFQKAPGSSYLGVLGIMWARSDVQCWNKNSSQPIPGCNVTGGGHVEWQPWIQRHGVGQGSGWSGVKLATFDPKWRDTSFLGSAMSQALSDLSSDTTPGDNVEGEVATLVAFFIEDTSHASVYSWDPDVGVDDSLDTSSAMRLGASLLAVAMSLFAFLFVARP